MTRQTRYSYLIENQKVAQYVLPTAVLTAYAAVARLRQHTIPEPVVVDLVGDAAAELGAAARSGAKLLTRVAGLAEHEADQAQVRAARAALELATTEAQLDYEATVIDQLEMIVTDHLAPVHAGMVAEARKLWPKIATITSPTAAVSADDDTRTAYLRFDELAIQMGLLLDTAARTNAAGEARAQHAGIARHYTVVRNPATVWPAFSRLQHQVRDQATGPWAGTVRDRLAWLAATPAAEAWLPTYRELNALVDERHADEFAAHKRGKVGGQAVRVWGGRAA